MLKRVMHSECLEEYRHMRYRMNTMQHVESSLDDGTTCPACPVPVCSVLCNSFYFTKVCSYVQIKPADFFHKFYFRKAVEINLCQAQSCQWMPILALCVKRVPAVAV